MNLNQTVIIGRLTRDPEIRSTTEGVKVANFTVAVNGYQDHTDFIPCVAWRQSAEFLEKYAAKGSEICVSGRINQRIWEKDGQKRSALEVYADRVQLTRTSAPTESKSAGDNVVDEIDVLGEDLPF